VVEIPQDFVLATETTPFPDIERALEEPNGLIAIGGSLSTERLLDAYHQVFFLGIASKILSYGTVQIQEW